MEINKKNYKNQCIAQKESAQNQYIHQLHPKQHQDRTIPKTPVLPKHMYEDSWNIDTP